MFSCLLKDLGKGLQRTLRGRSNHPFLTEALPKQTKRTFFITSYRLCKIDMSHFDVIFVLGGPGAGKGTQCSKIVEKYGFVHLSAGELLREEQKKEDSEYGNIIQHHMVSGTIVPASITCALLKNAMVNAQYSKKFLIDGYPRNQDNVEEWEKSIGPLVNFRFLLFFDCDKETCIQRCLQRGVQGSGRADDNKEVLEKRFITYYNSTKVVIDAYESSGKVRRVDASKDIDSVFAEVQTIMNEDFGSSQLS